MEVAYDFRLSSRLPFLLNGINQAFLTLCNTYPDRKICRFAIAVSGGRDSMVLLRLLQTWLVTYPQISSSIRLHVFHIHHGLQQAANDWQKFVADYCKQQGLHFATKNVTLTDLNKTNNASGIEAAARSARYDALFELAREHDCQVLVTAHHQQDQSETFLLQALRGSGLAGLVAMPVTRMMDNLHISNPSKQTPDAIILWRPLLEVNVNDLAQLASHWQLAWVEDPSNQDIHYRRNFIRHDVLPILRQHVPEADLQLQQSIKQLQSSYALLHEYLEADLVNLQYQYYGCFALSYQKLSRLSINRRFALLHCWCKQIMKHTPTQKSLAIWWQQIELAHQRTSVGKQPSLSLTNELGLNYLLVNYRDHIFIQEMYSSLKKTFFWQGETEIIIPEKKGRWVFIRSHAGFKYNELFQQMLTIDDVPSNASLRFFPTQATKTLAKLGQEKGIAPTLRQQFVGLYLNKKILAIEHIGMNWQNVSNVSTFAADNSSMQTENYIQIDWHADE